MVLSIPRIFKEFVKKKGAPSAFFNAHILLVSYYLLTLVCLNAKHQAHVKKKYHPMPLFLHADCHNCIYFSIQTESSNAGRR